MDDLRRDVGEDSSEGLRAKLSDHVKICGDRWEKLALELRDLRGDVRKTDNTIKVAAGLVSFIVLAGLAALALILKR